MAEHIEREAAKEAVKYIPWCDWKAVGDCIDELPAADVVPVVRCGECARRYTELCALYAGQMNGKDYFIQQGDDFFCKKGQRWEG